MKPLTLFLLATPFTALLAEEPDPKSLNFTKWTPDFQVPDPVAISFDNQGRAYVTQTQRRKANDLDIRQNRDWIPDDLSFQSPDDKRAFYWKQFTAENSDANKHRVKDYNKDGIHDLRDLQMLTERIHLIEDTDGNGLADKTSIYAQGFDNEIAGIAAGVLHHDGDVYTTIVPDVWKLCDNDADGKADTREKLATGFGVHLAYAGHDMHGLTVGPDGRIYWTIGDKGVGATSKEGLHFKYPNQGALLRCNPDGSGFEVYARGLRNVQEIAFDQYGNIFGIDNDSDRPGEKERFIYIVQHMDAGWRANWQYRQGTFNPWMDEGMSIPYHEGQPAHILPAISLYEDGPAGMAFNPGTALNEEWKNYFFHTGAPRGPQWAFQVEQNGASYKMVNDMQISGGVPIVGINFGPDGALYGVDWGGGYPLNKKGAVWKWDVENKHPLREETAHILRERSFAVSVGRLAKYLEHPDQRVRFKGQFELVKRGFLEELQMATAQLDKIGRIHAIWGIGQLHRKKESPDFKFLLDLLSDPDVEIRTQVIKIIGDHFGTQLALHQATAPSVESSSVAQALKPFLKDSSPRVKFHTAIALGNIGSAIEVDAIHDLLGQAGEENTYLRHAAIVLATGCSPDADLVALAKHDSELIQKVAVVALRRRASSSVTHFLSSPYENVVAEAARTIHDDWTIPEAIPNLAASLETTPWGKNQSIILRTINASFHLGTPEAAQRVAAFSTRCDVPIKLRLDALDALSKWTQPKKLDRVVGRYRPLAERDSTIAKDALSSQLSKLLIDPESSIQSKAMSLARSLEIELPSEALVTLAENKDSLPELKVEALRALHSQEYSRIQELLTAALQAKQADVRIEALALLAHSNPEQALNTIDQILQKKGGNLSEKQAALALLIDPLTNNKASLLLLKFVGISDTMPAGLQLDLAEAAAVRKINYLGPNFSQTLVGGNAERGEDIFMNHLAAQCVRCHKVDNSKGGSSIGPNLKSVGLTRDRAHLLQSLTDPQADIAEGYGTISLSLHDGTSVVGQFRKEKKGLLEIADTEGKVTKIKTTEVKERTPVMSTMPPMGLILQKREVRDLIEYLSTLKSKK